MTGEVISVSKTGYFVKIGDNTHFCLINNSFKAADRPIVGDIVELKPHEDQFLILDILPRRSFVSRYDEFKQKFQYFAANVDVVFIVTSANREFSRVRLMRFLSLVGDQPIRPVVVVTKIDEAKNFDILKNFQDIDAVAINALDAGDVKKLFKFWKAGETALMLGTSGVGKSTIINSLCGLGIKTRQSQSARRQNKGRHTTSARTLYYLDDGRKIIDSPGVKIVSSGPEF